MAAKPQMTVRLAPSILHALIYLAERDGVAPAELARTLITAASQQSLDRHGWRADCQDAYMRWLAARRDAEGGEITGDIAVVEGLRGGSGARVDPSPLPRADGPYGPSATVRPLFEDPALPAKPLSEIIGEADRLVATSRPDGRKRRS